MMAIAFVLSSCSSRIYVDEGTLQKLIASDEFTFMAERANPTNYDVVNVMNNSLPGATSSRILNLDYGYTVVVNPKKVEVQLPYFGRMFSPSYDTSKNSYRFTSEDFRIEKNEGKNGSTDYVIYPKDQQHIQRIIIQIQKNGKAYVSLDSNDRQPISYDGYLMKNETK